MTYFAQEIKIAHQTIGKGHPVFIVAEIGINHNGDMNLAKKMIDSAKAAGVDSVKFQNYVTEDFLSPDKELNYEYETINGKIVESQFEMFKKCELSNQEVKELAEYCNKVGIIFHSTPTSTAGVDLLVEQNTTILKNGSDFLTNSRLIQHMAKTGLPLVLATGMADEEEIAEAVNTVYKTENKNLILLHCTSAYPTPIHQVNLRKMNTIANRFGCLSGLSDHSEGSIAAVGATALGACWIEKHFTLDKALPGPDHRFSNSPEEISQLVQAVRNMEILLGTDQLGPSECELNGRVQYRLSCAAAKDLHTGDILEEEDIIFRRPADGVPPSKIDFIIGKSLLRDVPQMETLKLEYFSK